MKRSHALAFLATLLIAVSAHAITYDVTIAFDTDRKTSTGCTFGTFAGAEQLLITHVNVAGGVATVTGVTRQACVAGSFAGAVPVDTHNWSGGLTPTGNLFIETHVNPTDIGDSMLTPMRVGFFVTDGTHSDAVVSTRGGTTMFFPDGLRRRAVGATPPATRTITLDGNDGDWTGVTPVAGGGGGTADLRIRSGFAFAAPGGDLFFGVGLQANHNAPTANDDSYTLPTAGGSLSVNAATGVLTNDTDPNHLPLTAQLVAGVQHGTLTLNANGSFDYTNDGSPAQVDTFEYKANNGTLDSNTAQVQIGIGAGGGPNPPPTPKFTSDDHTTFTTAIFNSFTVTTTPAHPTPTITEPTPLPSGVSFHDNGDGTATISGTPLFGGVFTFTMTATNPVGSANQLFTLTINQPPTFTSNNAATFTVGSAGSFIVTATGFPDPSLSESGALPNGVSFIDHGDGTAALQGTPAAGTGGIYTLLLSATNSAGTATQTFTLTVNEAPFITTPATNQTVCAGSQATFTAAAGGFPAPTVQWQVSSGGPFNNIPGATSTTLSFTATSADNGKQYRAVFTNGVGSPAQTTATLTVNVPPTVTTNPVSQTICAGLPVTFTAAATATPAATVQWQVNSGSGFTNIPGATSASLTFTTATADNGKQYRAVFTNTCGTSNTTAATLTVNAAPVVTGQPNNVTVCAGATASFTVTFTGTPAPTVQWQVNSGSGFTNIPGATSATLSFSTVAADNGKQYRAVLTNSCNTVNSNAATLTVNTTPVVTTNPLTQTVCAGSTATFTAAASGAPAPTVQWQVNTGSGFNDIPGATSATLSFTSNAAQSGNQYRAVFTNSCGTATTTAATLTVNVPPAVTTQPVAVTVCAGATASFTAAASGTPAPTVQWQVDSGSGFSDIPGATSATLSFSTVAGDNGKQYRAVFTNSCGTATTNAVALRVDTLPVVSTDPLTQTICAGSPVTFTAAATSNAGQTVQWQVDTGSGFNNIPGATTTSLTFITAASDNGKKYRAVFTNSCGSTNTAAATLVVDTLPTVTTDPVSQAVCPGGTATFTAAATSNAGDQTVQWQVDSGSGFTNIPGATTTTLSFTVAPADNGKQYRAVFTDACGSTPSAAATLTVNAAPVVTTNPTNQLVCAGATATFTAAASGTPSPTVQWQVDSGSGFTDIPGATSTTLSFTSTAGQNGNKYRAVFSNVCGSGVTSSFATLTVDTLPVVGTNPVSQIICAGSPVTFTAAATSNASDHTVQWQVNAGSGFTDIPGATSTTLSFTTATGDNGKQYRAVFTDACGSATSSAATLTVDTIPVVTTDPVSQTVCSGATATFTAAATSNANDQTVQWQVDSGSGFTDIPGATSTTLSFATVNGDNGKQYRAVFTTACGSTPTAAATLTVDTLPVVTTDPVTQTVCAGSPVTFTAAATSNASDHTVQWQVNNGSGFTNIPGATSTTLTFIVANGDNANQYRAVFTDACGSTNSAAAVLTVDTLPTVTTDPTNQTVCSGGTATFTAAASSNAGDQTVQWQVDSGSGFTNIPGATSTTLSFVPVNGDNGKKYRAVFTTACGSTNSNFATLTVDTLPVVTTNPLTQTLCAGATVNFTAAATSNASDHTVQWQVDTGSGFNDIPGATSTTLSFVVAAGDNGKKYRAVFTDACGSTPTTAATLTVDTLPVVTTDPVTQTLCAGATVNFTAAATSNANDQTVQWQVDSGSGFTNIPGATSTTLSFVTAAGDNGKKYRAVFTTACGSTNTNFATLTVDTLPVVTTNPLTQTLCAGATVNFTAAATSNASDHTVQWQVDTGSGFNNIPGATSTTLSFVVAAGDNGKKYRAVFTDACGSTNTSSATLTVDTLPVITTNPVSQAICSGSPVTFTAAATSNANDQTVQWQVDAGSGFTNIPGATTTSLSFTVAPGDNGKQYRAVFTTACGSTPTSAATLTVTTPPAVTSDPTNTTVCAGSTASFTATASGNPAPTVQWQVDSGSGFTDIPGATSATLSFTAAAADSGKKYRAVFTNACGTATSNFATLTVNTAPAVTTDPVSQSIQAGNSVTFTAAASGSPAPTVQWQISTGGGPFADIPGATTTSLSFTTSLSQNGNQYRAVFTNSCGTATTAAATLTVTCPTFAFTPNGTMPQATYHTAYSQNISVSGGTAPYTLVLDNGTSMPSTFTFTDNGNGTATVASANPGVTGTFTFDVKATDSGGCHTTLTFTLKVAPKEVDDTYATSGGNAGSPDSVGNTESIAGGFTAPGTPYLSYTNGVLANDDAPGGTLTVTTSSVTNAAGTITFTTAGAWDYVPAAGFTGTATFNFTISSNGVTAPGTINIVVSNKVWYVKNNAAGGGNGVSSTPFNTLAAAQAASAIGDTIYVSTGDGGTTGQNAGIVLKNNQTLFGAGVATFTVGTTTITTPGAGTKPQITNATANSDAITLADGNTVKGLTVTGATRDGIAGNTHAGFIGDTLTIQNNTASGLHLTSMTGTVTVTNASITGNAIGLDVNNGTAAITLDNTNTITANAGQRQVAIQNRPAAAGAIALGATINDSVVGSTGILVNNNASGTISFTGAQTLRTTTNPAITLTTNTGTTVNFSGTLNITTTTGSALNATGGGTLGVSGTANVTTGAAATGININGVTSGGITFTTVNTTNATTGVSLTSLGNGNVTINGGTISGGTTGLSLNTLGTSNITLSGVTITGATGTAITGATFGTLTISGAAVNVSGVNALNLSTGAVTGTFNNVSATAGSVTLNAVTGTWGTTGGAITGAAGAPAFGVTGGSGGTITWGGTISQALANTVVNISGSNSNTINFNGNVTSSGTSTGLIITGSSGAYTFSGTNAFSGATGILIGNGASESGSVSFSNSTTNTVAGSAFVVDGGAAGSITAAITYSGTIDKATAGSGGILVSVNKLNSGGGSLSMSHVPAAAGNIKQNANAANGLSVTNSSSASISISDAQIVGKNNNLVTVTGNTGTITLNGLSATTNGPGAVSIKVLVLSGGGTLNIGAGAANPVLNNSAGTTAAANTIDGTGFTGTFNISNATITGNATADTFTMNGGTLGGTGSTIAAAASRSLVLSGVTLVSGAGMTAVNSTGGTHGISLTNVVHDGTNGTYTITGGTLSGNTTAAFFMDGGNANVTFGGNITATGFLVDIGSTTTVGGNQTFSGTLGGAAAGAGGTGIRVQRHTTNTVAFSGTQTLGTTANRIAASGVTLASNTGGTINFSGTLAIATSNAGTAFSATGGGTVTVTGASNTIDALSGTALDITSTTIGAANVTFLSISAGNNTAAADPVNGINLSSTGASGHLAVTGSGSANSGGTIQHVTGQGIALANTLSPSFDRMNINNCAQNGVQGLATVTNFTFTNSTIDTVGTGAAGQYLENNITFNDGGFFSSTVLTGTVNISGNTLNNARRSGIDIENGGGTISNLTIQNNSLTSAANTSTSLGSGIMVLQQGDATHTAHLTTGTVSGNSVNNFPNGELIFFGGGSGSSSNSTSSTLGANGTPIAITGNFINGGATQLSGNGIRISMNSTNGVSNFNINGNGSVAQPLTNKPGHTITVFMGGNITGTTNINSNRIVSNNTANSEGIVVQVDDGPAALGTAAADYNFIIDSNNTSATNGPGIRAIARASNDHMDVTITNNTCATPTASNTPGIRVDSGSAAGNVSTCLKILSNTTSGSGLDPGIGLRKQGTVAATNAFGISTLGGTTSAAATQTQVASDNPGSTGGCLVISGDNFIGCTPTP